MTIIASTSSVTAWDYTELKSKIAEWMHRSDVTTLIPDFITLAEQDINTDLRTRLMEVDSTLSLVSGTRTVSLPDYFSEPIRLDLVIAGQQNETLLYVTPQQMAIASSTGSAVRPITWTINGSLIEFPAISDATYTLLFRNLQDFNIESTLTNSLLTSYPSVYLYRAMYHAAAWAEDNNGVAKWDMMYKNAVTRVNKSEARAKTLTSLRTELPMSSNVFNNIFMG